MQRCSYPVVTKQSRYIVIGRITIIIIIIAIFMRKFLLKYRVSIHKIFRIYTLRFAQSPYLNLSTHVKYISRFAYALALSYATFHNANPLVHQQLSSNSKIKINPHCSHSVSYKRITIYISTCYIPFCDLLPCIILETCGMWR